MNRAQPPSSDSKRRLDAFWDGCRDYYAQAAAANPEASPERRLLLGHLHSGQRVFDLGCGSCENALWLPEGCRYVGFDVSTSALALAREWGRPGQRVRGDGETLPVASASVDAVLSTYALEHFHDPARTLLEAARILRPGGLLLLVGSAWDLPYEMPPSLDPARRLEVSLRRLGRQLLSALDGRHRFDVVAHPRVLTEGYVPDADAVHVTQSHLLVRFLRAAGLEILDHRTQPHGPDPPHPRALLRLLLRSFPLWRHAWGNTLIIARRTSTLREPPYSLLPL
jgi:SAM-dependent methyltransferase